MRRSDIMVGLFLGVTLWSTGFAAAATPAKPLPSVATTQADCEKTGSDISALIDASAMSPNISAARAVFQVGIMNCMEDEPDKAIKRYEDAKKLLGNPTKAPAVPLPKR